jgi:hypothetical protein
MGGHGVVSGSGDTLTAETTKQSAYNALAA